VDQLALELGDAGEHRQHHAPCRRGRARPRFRYGAQASACVVQLLGDIKQVPGRSREPIEPRHYHHVLVADLVEHPRQLGPVALRA
jgi:hypothetical protein